MDMPNIILITCHDLGDTLGCYGHPVRTPHLDALAADGVLLENHFSAGSVCSPSRGALMTGCYPHTNALMGLVHRGWRLNVRKCPPLPLLMATAGYETLLFGLQHEHWDPKRIGYQRHAARKPPHYCDKVIPMFIRWLRERGQRIKPSKRKKARPFFASLGFMETHRIDLGPSHFRRDAYEPADPGEVRVPPYLPDIGEVRQELAEFYGAVNLVDRMVGDMMGALEETGFAENTLVLFTTDHGPSFMHAKGTLYDGGCKAAAIIRWPGMIPGGRRCRALTSHVDLVPSLFHLVGLSLPQPVERRIEGESFSSILYGGSAIERPYVFAEKNYTNYYDPARMVRSAQHKYIRKGLRSCIFDFVIPELELCPTSFRSSREVFEFYPARRTTEELYDLAADPGEMNNLIDDPEYSDQLDELRTVLDDHLEETSDPFRNVRNPILMPAGSYELLRKSTR